LGLTPRPAQALPHASCGKLSTWAAGNKALRGGTWGTEPVYKASLVGTTLHNAEFVAWLDDPCFVSHEDFAVAERPVVGHGYPDPAIGVGSARSLLARIYGPEIASDFSSAVVTRLPNELVLLGGQYAYVLHWVDETGVPGQYPSYTEWAEIWPRNAQLPDH
jgi:hypothetical protein